MADSPRLQQIRNLLQDDPDDPFLRYGLAMELISLGDSTEAVEIFRDLMQRTPGYVPTYLMLAQTLQRQGKEPEAANVLRSGIAVAQAAGEEHAMSELQALLAIVE